MSSRDLLSISIFDISTWPICICGFNTTRISLSLVKISLCQDGNALIRALGIPLFSANEVYFSLVCRPQLHAKISKKNPRFPREINVFGDFPLPLYEIFTLTFRLLFIGELGVFGQALFTFGVVAGVVVAADGLIGSE